MHIHAKKAGVFRFKCYCTHISGWQWDHQPRRNRSASLRHQIFVPHDKRWMSNKNALFAPHGPFSPPVRTSCYLSHIRPLLCERMYSEVWDTDWGPLFKQNQARSALFSLYDLSFYAVCLCWMLNQELKWCLSTVMSSSRISTDPDSFMLEISWTGSLKRAIMM